MTFDPAKHKCYAGSKINEDETMQHIISGCEKLAGTCYLRRHNNLVQYVYWCLARKHKIEVADQWWKEILLQPQVKENSLAKILWEMPVQTDVPVSHNRPDLIYVDKNLNRLWNTQTTVVPIVIGATGIVAKNKEIHRSIESNIDISILQKQAVIYTSLILNRVLGDAIFEANTADQQKHDIQQSSNLQQSIIGYTSFIS
ncbi:uncharacterized protein LOC111633665 [Centruroides sculpturatus]|uniref:uncharacterized protein LOC111633665 n=1 Tax=Centruroides sculpturatus TaxID=218467 RepID=UPI000C6D92BD|nr:uncharacterized protein LOC111633665 [Centruroides sculpturatus]